MLLPFKFSGRKSNRFNLNIRVLGPYDHLPLLAGKNQDILQCFRVGLVTLHTKDTDLIPTELALIIEVNSGA